MNSCKSCGATTMIIPPVILFPAAACIEPSWFCIAFPISKIPHSVTNTPIPDTASVARVVRAVSPELIAVLPVDAAYTLTEACTQLNNNVANGIIFLKNIRLNLVIFLNFTLVSSYRLPFLFPIKKAITPNRSTTAKNIPSFVKDSIVIAAIIYFLLFLNKRKGDLPLNFCLLYLFFSKMIANNRTV